jgi:Zn-dependent protease
VSDPSAEAAAAPRLRPALPSLNFLLLLLVFCASGAALWHDVLAGRFTVFVFVVAGWVVSLCLHEFGHALVAFVGGDRAIARTGYLDLDPMRYTDPALSILLPVVCILIGGFGLPGGAVYIRNGMLRSRAWVAATAAAGPLMNLLFLLALAALAQAAPEPAGYLSAGLGALALFQATAIILNLLPCPGLDGFGIIRAFLSRPAAARADQIGGAALLILFLLLWLTRAGGLLIRAGLDIVIALGFDPYSVAGGFRMLKLF